MKNGTELVVYDKEEYVQGPLLSTVTETLGTTVMAVWVDAADPGARCDDVVIHDAAAEFAAGPGDLLLAVGVDPATAVGVIDAAARHQVTAVVVRATPELRACLSGPARRAGVALLGLAADVGWARFTGQLRGLLTTTGAEVDAGPAGPPSRELADFANALCESVGGSVMIFNPQQEVLAFSRLAESDDPMRRQAVLDQRGPAWYRARLREHGVYRRLWRSDDVVDIPAVPDRNVRRRIAVAVRSGDEILGSIWVAERGAPLDPDAKVVLRGAAASAAQYLSRLGARSHTRRHATEAIARRVLGGETDDEVVEWLDFDWDQPSAAMSCVFADTGQGDARSLAGLLSVHLPAMDCVAVPVPARGRVDVLLCQLGGRDAAELATAAREVVQRAAAASGAAVLAALGPVVPGAERVPDSLAEADLVLRVLRRSGAAETRVARPEEVRAAADVLALADEVGSRPRFARGPVPDLLAYDREHHTGYAASLAAYLDALGDVIAAARALHVHPNTLRYRLRRMGPICGIDLNDPDERLVAALHLRRADLDQPTSRGTKAESPV
ncbi:PucR-like helix-turn-helix protein [Murinocardiopsis flavida]|uniref:PucR-like helix-turn-helix protein n=1 Tax=Murinocardiopsis flavida TaxID=645275 RepID=A0A2P8CZ38_9ACTN|nr:helix-turn-helix domain-containing protein [Murinocardiopsis flavida]PSK90220.1 PucR-like helix-turn-helix protein [Murinocardiopsis flavida]